MKRLNFFLAGVLIFLWLAGSALTAENKVVFLDVGQGDSILLQHGTKQVLVDAGPGSTVLQRLGEELPWLDRRIDVVILTHPDRDHLEGFLYILEKYDVSLVLLPRVVHTTNLYHDWLNILHDAVTKEDVEFRFAWQGQSISLGEMTVEILGPSREVVAATRPGRTNNASVISRVDTGGLSFLLTGDAEASAERTLVRTLSDGLLSVDVLKAGHHGSRTSTTQELFDAASPDTVVISVGRNNSYGHPHPDVIDRLRQLPVWRTDEHGSVAFLRRGDDWFVKTRGVKAY